MPAARRALLLDFDGTVIDSVELIYQCLDQTARAHLGMPFPRQLWEDHIGKPLIETFALLGEQTAAQSEILVADYRRRQVECSDQLRVFTGIPEALTTLRDRGVRLAIVTTKVQRIAREHLKAIGMLDHFEVVIGFDDCTAAKPDPEPFQLAMRALQLQPGDCVAVGDTAHDIHGARAAGVLAAAALWSGVATAGLLAARPDRVLHAPAELLTIIDD